MLFDTIISKNWRPFYVDLLFSVYLHIYRAIALMSEVFGNGPRDQSLISSRVILKTQKMVKGKVEQSSEWSWALSFSSVKLLLKMNPPVTFDLGHQLYLLLFRSLFFKINLFYTVLYWSHLLLR